MNTDWQVILFAPENKMIERFEKLAQKKFYWDEILRDEAYNDAFEKVVSAVKNGIKEPTSNPKGYLFTIFSNGLIDFSRKKSGYIRPNTAIKKLGKEVEKIWHLHCLKCLKPTEIIKRYQGRQDLSQDFIDDISNLIKLIKKLDKKCGNHNKLPVSVGGRIDKNKEQQPPVETSEDAQKLAEAFPEQEKLSASAEKQLLVEQYKQTLNLIAVITGIDFDQQIPKDKKETILKDFKKEVTLTANDQLLLKMKYVDGKKIPFISKALKMAEKDIRKREKQILKVLKQYLTENNIHI